MKKILLPLGIIAGLTNISEATTGIDQIKSKVQSICTTINLDTIDLGQLDTGIDFCGDINKTGVSYYALIRKTLEKIPTGQQDDFLNCFYNNISSTPSPIKIGPIGVYLDTTEFSIITESSASICAKDK